MIPANRQIHAKLEIIRPNGTWVDVTEYLESVDVELGSIERMGTEATGADIGVRTLSFTLRNDGQRVKYWDSNTSLGDSNDNIGDAESVLDIETIVGQGQWARNSFAPRDRTSAWNLVNGQWVPLLWPYREVILEVSATAPGEAPNWVTLFEGYMGDDISTEGHFITVTCRDKSKRLMDAYIDVAKTYEGPMSPEDLIQAIINDYVESPPTLYCPIPSGMTFEKMTVEYASVWDAIQNVATQTGWFLGYRWNGQAFVLTFLEPPRGRNTPDFEFNWEDDIYHETLNVSDKDIRNALTISFRDSTTGERRTLSYQDYPELRNDASKEEYGGLYRIMQIEEADTSLIDTEEKALAFGEKCIWDLSELSATDRLNLPLLPELDLFSTFTVENPLTSSTKDFYAVQSIRHTLSFGESGRFRTEVIATGRVVGAKTKWQDMETRPGRPGDPNQKGKDGSGVTMAFKRSETKPDTPMPSGGMPPGWYADVESTTGSGPLWATVGTRADSKSFWIWQEPVKMEGEDGEDFVPPKPATPVWAGYTLTNVLTVNWHIAEHASDYEIRENLNWGNAVGLVFRGYAHSLSFIPKSREFILYLRALNAAGEYSDGYAILTVSLPAPSPPSQPDVEAYFNALKIRPVPLASPSVMGYYVYISGDGISDKVPVVAGGSLTYPLPSGTTVVIQVSAYDILGEGGKSQPLQATTTALDPLDLPEIPESKLEESLREKINTAYETADDALEFAEDALERIPHIILFSNENQSFLTDSDGVVEAQTVVSSEITVFKGKDLIAATIGDVVVKGSDGTPITAGTITKSNPTYATPGHVTWAIPAGTNVPSDAGYIEVPITVEETTYIKKLYWTKAKRGQIGPQGPQGEPAPYARVQYSTAPSGAEWHDTYAEGRKWMRMSTDGGYTWSTPAKIVGEDGEPGEDGSYVEYQFAKNTSLTEAPSSGWQDSPPAISTSEYLWMRVRTVTPSGAGNWSTPVRISGPKGDKGDKGDPGAAARLVTISASQGYFVGKDERVGDEYVRTFTPASITITPEFQHCEYSKWQYSLDGQTFSDVVSGQNGLNIDSVTKALTIGALSPLYGDNRQTVLFRILSTTGEYDQMTIARIYDADNLVDRTRAMETRIEQTDERIGLTAERVDRTESDIAQHAAQIQLLGDEITLKVQRTVDGQMVVTGIGMGFDETGQSIIPVLADRFVVKSGVNDEGQYAFLVDSETGKVYVPGELTVGGLVRATELQAELAKVLLLQAELAYLDEANVLHLRADKITVGGSASPSSGIPLPKPAGSHVWHYDRHMSSTDGIGPTSASGAVVVGDGGIAGGSLKLESGGAVVYTLPGPVSSYTWAGFYEEE